MKFFKVHELIIRSIENIEKYIHVLIILIIGINIYW